MGVMELLQFNGKSTFQKSAKKKKNKIKKMQVYQQFDVDIVPACNFILKKGYGTCVFL